MAFKVYNYKIQWHFGNSKGGIVSSFKLIDAIGSKSLDVINARDGNLKIIDSYSGVGYFSYPEADRNTKNWIRKQSKNSEVFGFEFLRR